MSVNKHFIRPGAINIGKSSTERDTSEGFVTFLDLGEFDSADIGVLITPITEGLPTPEDVERVRARQAAKRWPLNDPRDPEASA